MTNRDAAAAESAELATLRDQAARDQQALAATLRELSAKLADGPALRARARHAAISTVRSGAHTAWRAVRHRVSGHPLVSGRPAGGRRRAAAPVLVAVPVCTLAVAVTWRQVRSRSARRRSGTRR
jgi:hypothetical protein